MSPGFRGTKTVNGVADLNVCVSKITNEVTASLIYPLSN